MLNRLYRTENLRKTSCVRRSKAAWQGAPAVYFSASAVCTLKPPEHPASVEFLCNFTTYEKIYKNCRTSTEGLKILKHCA